MVRRAGYTEAVSAPFSPTDSIVNWLARQDQETQQFVLLQLMVMGGRAWLEVDGSPGEIDVTIDALRRLERGPLEDVGLAIWLRGLISFAVSKMGEQGWSVGEKVNREMLKDPDPQMRQHAERFFAEQPLREKRWQRVAADWREFKVDSVTDEKLDEWLAGSIVR